MYEQPKVTILLFLEDDIVTGSNFNEGTTSSSDFTDENVDPDGWVD